MKIIIKKYLEYIISFLFKLYYIDNLSQNPNIINEVSSVQIRILNINNKYNKLIKNIENEFWYLLKDINRIEK